MTYTSRDAYNGCAAFHAKASWAPKPTTVAHHKQAMRSQNKAALMARAQMRNQRYHAANHLQPAGLHGRNQHYVTKAARRAALPHLGRDSCDDAAFFARPRGVCCADLVHHPLVHHDGARHDGARVGGALHAADASPTEALTAPTAGADAVIVAPGFDLGSAADFPDMPTFVAPTAAALRAMRGAAARGGSETESCCTDSESLDGDWVKPPAAAEPRGSEQGAEQTEQGADEWEVVLPGGGGGTPSGFLEAALRAPARAATAAPSPPVPPCRTPAASAHAASPRAATAPRRTAKGTGCYGDGDEQEAEAMTTPVPTPQSAPCFRPLPPAAQRKREQLAQHRRRQSQQDQRVPSVPSGPYSQCRPRRAARKLTTTHRRALQKAGAHKRNNLLGRAR